MKNDLVKHSLEVIHGYRLAPRLLKLLYVDREFSFSLVLGLTGIYRLPSDLLCVTAWT
ncbi:MAG: hypothetical protein OXE92_09945 [Bacteroidetes bacterium]|nr:hypothetical protein [Bacteroidota bacterium]